MPMLYESSISYFCNSETYRFHASVLVSKKEFREHIEQLSSVGEYDRKCLLDSMITTNPYGGATHTPIADTLREYVGDWLEEYGFDSFHLEGRDFKYMFRSAQVFKSVHVTAIIPKKKFLMMKLKYPDLAETFKLF